MLKTCVLIADRARARLMLTVIPPERFAGGARLELQEVEALTEPEGALTGEQLFANPARSGTNRSPGGGAFEYDDHRDEHREQVERRFAKRVAAATRDLLQREHAPRLVLAVEPHLLGMMRKELTGSLPPGTELIELAKDLSWHTPQRVLEALERAGAIEVAPAQ